MIDHKWPNKKELTLGLMHINWSYRSYRTGPYTPVSCIHKSSSKGSSVQSAHTSCICGYNTRSKYQKPNSLNLRLGSIRNRVRFNLALGHIHIFLGQVLSIPGWDPSYLVAIEELWSPYYSRENIIKKRYLVDLLANQCHAEHWCCGTSNILEVRQGGL